MARPERKKAIVDALAETQPFGPRGAIWVLGSLPGHLGIWASPICFRISGAIMLKNSMHIFIIPYLR